jgi:tRNA pseudouridine55 synthase
LDKPSGITSARAVALVKRCLPKGTKIGHTGTLDPLASGLLVLLLGRATRLSRYVTGLDKSYVATASFGAVSDTLDAEGRITRLQNTSMPNEDTIREALLRFTGDILQTPPMASAVKVGGERLYKAQRRGETVERESRPVTVHAFELLTLDATNATATFRVSCSSGTYVRTLVSDLAAYLNTGAYLSGLCRTSVGHLAVQHATPPENITPKIMHKCIIQAKEVVAHLPRVEVQLAERASVCNGRPLGRFGSVGSFRVEAEGELLAIYRGEGDGAKAEVVLCDP